MAQMKVVVIEIFEHWVVLVDDLARGPIHNSPQAARRAAIEIAQTEGIAGNNVMVEERSARLAQNAVLWSFGADPYPPSERLIQDGSSRALAAF